MSAVETFAKPLTNWYRDLPGYALFERSCAAALAIRREAEFVLEQRAKKLIDEVVRPLVAADGGQIELVKVVDRRIIVRMSGMCAGCPGRPYTLSGVIEPLARRILGADINVEAEND